MKEFSVIFFNGNRTVKIVKVTDISKAKARAMIEEMIDSNNQSIPADWDDYEIINMQSKYI